MLDASIFLRKVFYHSKDRMRNTFHLLIAFEKYSSQWVLLHIIVVQTMTRGINPAANTVVNSSKDKTFLDPRKCNEKNFRRSSVCETFPKLGTIQMD